MLEEVAYLPQVEGPGRLVKAYQRLLGGLEAIGCEPVTAWNTLTRVATDTVPALRTCVIRLLLAEAAAVKTATIAEGLGVTSKTVLRYLEDLALLSMATSERTGSADNAPYCWAASDWLRQYWPGDVSVSPDVNTSVRPRGTDGATEMFAGEHDAAMNAAARHPVQIPASGIDDRGSSTVPTLLTLQSYKDHAGEF